ncbi:hypothetical protein ACS0TY_028455 [Phlomoides rotata]
MSTIFGVIVLGLVLSFPKLLLYSMFIWISTSEFIIGCYWIWLELLAPYWGGVFRDHYGVFRGRFAARFGVSFAFEDELATAFIALELAFEKHWVSFWLETDFLYIVHVLKNRPSAVPWRLIARWHKI